MATTIKYTARFADNSTRTFTLQGVTIQDANPVTIKGRMNAYNEIWGWALPQDATKINVEGYEEYINAMRETFISTEGAEIVSLESAIVIDEEEVPIFNG